MSSLQLYDSFEKLKATSVARPLTEKEKERQQKATESLIKIKHTPELSS